MQLFKKRYPTMSFAENFLGGHVKLGPICVYGENAMHWGVNIKTRRWGYICFRLPFRCFKRWWHLYFYLSPNATPWASTFLVGREHSRTEKRAALWRRRNWGNGYNLSIHDPQGSTPCHLGD